MIEGKPHGPYTFYHKNGKKNLTVEFKHGQLHGDYIFYSKEDGKNGGREAFYWVYRYGNFIEIVPSDLSAK